MNATTVATGTKSVPTVVSSIQDIPLAKIRESKTNPRRFFDEAKLAELADRNKTAHFDASIWIACCSGHGRSRKQAARFQDLLHHWKREPRIRRGHDQSQISARFNATALS